MSGYFIPSGVLRRPEPAEKGILIAAGGGSALLQEEADLPGEALYIGELSGKSCFALAIEDLPPGGDIRSMRELMGEVEVPIRQALCRAGTICHWTGQHKFCGVCGRKLETSRNDESLLCSACSTAYFPQIAPAIIVAVEKEGRILLARNARSRNGMFGLVAGFVAAGESLEDAVRRELAEETGIEVADIRYEGSQPWPFPNSLMTGFSACWRSGEVTPDGTEIVEAGFFAPDEFPLIPGPGSIARKLIDKFTSAVSGRKP